MLTGNCRRYEFPQQLCHSVSQPPMGDLSDRGSLQGSGTLTDRLLFRSGENAVSLTIANIRKAAFRRHGPLMVWPYP